MKYLVLSLILLLCGCVLRDSGTVVGRFSRAEDIPDPPVIVQFDPIMFGPQTYTKQDIKYLVVQGSDGRRHEVRCSDTQYAEYKEGTVVSYTW